MRFSARDDIIQITGKWNGERFEDGRPKVSDDILNRMQNITLEEAWGPLWKAGYKYQFVSGFQTTNPGKKLIGRAVTSTLVPLRPDLQDILLDYGHKDEGRRGNYNQWVIDTLVEDDVIVIDLFDKIYQGTYVGGNLSTAVATRTKRGGAVIWGGIRDMEQIVKIPNLQIYHRGEDPTAIAEITMISMNGPTKIGGAVCLPGDIVFATISGVLFIPPHMAEICVVGAEKSHIKDVFGFARLADMVYTTAQIDTSWTLDMWEDFTKWIATDKRGEGFRHLDWSTEIEESKKLIEGAPPQVII